MPRNRWFWFEMAGLAFFWSWFSLLLKGLPDNKTRLMYLLVSHVVTSPVHVQVSLRSDSICLRPVLTCSFSPDRPIPLCPIDRRPGSDRIIPLETASYDDGCRMFSMDRILPWWIASAGNTSPLPANTETQPAESQSSGEAVLQGAGVGVCRVFLYRGVSLVSIVPTRYLSDCRFICYVTRNQRVLKVLRDVSNQLSLLQKVAAADARGELH